MFCVTIAIIGVVYAGRMGMLLKAHETKDKEVFFMRNRFQCRKITALMLTACLLVALILTGGLQTASVQAKRAGMSLSKKKLTLTLGKKSTATATLKVKNPAQKIVWKNSNKKIAVIKKTTGKKKQTIVLQAKKAGKTVITAKVGAKKFKCRVVVKKAKTEEKKDVTNVVTPGAVGVYATSATASGSAISVNVKFYNGSDVNATFSYQFSIEKLENGQWIKVQSAKDMIIPAVMGLIKPQGQAEASFVISETKEPVTSGTYRINTDLARQDGTPVNNSSTEFVLTVQ